MPLESDKSTYLVTGAAGFIGSHVARELLRRGAVVVGVDNLNEYYDPRLKQARLQTLMPMGLNFARADLRDQASVQRLWSEWTPDFVIHLAGQPGVRHGIDHPYEYTSNNVEATLVVLEACRQFPVRHLVYASSSSVYGSTAQLPFSPRNPAVHPNSLYAASKLATEEMAHAYSRQFGIPTTGLRFFTVYGPWGRPDMAYFEFARQIIEGDGEVRFTGENSVRDFTYIDDIVEGVIRVTNKPAEPDLDWTPSSPRYDTSSAPWRLFNIGFGTQIPMDQMIHLLAAAIGRKVSISYASASSAAAASDVPLTHADTAPLVEHTGFRPKTDIRTGIRAFARWVMTWYQHLEHPEQDLFGLNDPGSAMTRDDAGAGLALSGASSLSPLAVGR